MSKVKSKQKSSSITPPLSDIEEQDEDINDDEIGDEEDQSSDIESDSSNEDEPETNSHKKSKTNLEDENEPESIPEHIDSDLDEDQPIPDSESDENDETEYKRETESDEGDNESEIENEEPDQPEEDEILEALADEEDEVDANDEQTTEDAPEEIFGDGDEETGEEVKKRKSTSRSRTVKRRLFPFIQAKRKAIQSELRDPPLFYALGVRVRQETITYLQSECKMEAEIVKKLEKAIATATARIFKSEGIQPVVQSIVFKESYLEILRYTMGALLSLSIDEVIDELNADNYGYKSKLYASEHAIDKEMEDKIKNPDDVTDDPNYPCPKCGGTKHTRLLIQDRSGDEGASLTLWCESKACGKKWKIRG